MNERILQLARQAGANYYSLGNRFEEFDEHKFAELIVRECMSFQDEAGVYSKFDMANAIARCFGVEE